jgi:hypothetical protein
MVSSTGKKTNLRGCRIQKNPYVLRPFMMPDTSSPRIPTLRKAHLPPGFAYPVGSGAVSEVLVSVPQFPKLTLSFSNVTPLLRPPLRVPGFPVLRLTYSNYPQYIPRNVSPENMARTFGGERWHIEILPTHVDRRPVVQQLLIEKGIGLLRDWVISPEAPTGAEQIRRIVEVWYFYDTGVIKLHIVPTPAEAAEKYQRQEQQEAEQEA